MTKGKGKFRVADDIRASLQEALKYSRGETADVIVHRVVPSASAARKARLKLGLPAGGEDVIRSRRGSKHGRIA